MKQSIISIVALLVSVCTLVFSFLHKAPKIGYAETSVLLSEFSEAIKARVQLEDAQKEWDKNLKQVNDSLEQAMDQVKLNFDKASPKEKKILDQNLKKWNTDFNRYSQAIRKMSEDKEKALMDPVINNLNEYLKQWGRNHGYDMIFGTITGGNLLQANESFNLTNQILKDLNEQFRDLSATKQVISQSRQDSTDSLKKRNK